MCTATATVLWRVADDRHCFTFSCFSPHLQFIPRDLTFNILLNLETWDGRIPVPAILKPQPLWTGKQLFSCLLPKINMAHTSNNVRSNTHSCIACKQMHNFPLAVR
jgi:hypothetical protein